MSTDYTARLIVGVPVEAVLEIQKTETLIPQWNPNTGEKLKDKKVVEQKVFLFGVDITAVYKDNNGYGYGGKGHFFYLNNIKEFHTENIELSGFSSVYSVKGVEFVGIEVASVYSYPDPEYKKEEILVLEKIGQMTNFLKSKCCNIKCGLHLGLEVS